MAGCSVAPRVDDLGVLDTYDVGDRLRCEMRDAIRGYAIEYIRSFNPETAHDLESGRITFLSAYKSKLHPAVRAMVDKYDGVTVGYAFTFDIKEDNNNGGGLTLGRAFSRGADTVGFTANLNLQRRNIRNYRQLDTFADLATALSDDRCPFEKNKPNYLYPIFGSLGLDKFVGAFLDANQSQRLVGPPEHPDVPTMSENLQFTTKVGASANPGFTITAVKKVFEIAAFNIKFDENREDLHQVIITLAPPPDVKAPQAARIATTRQAVRIEQANAIVVQNSQYLRDFSQFGVNFR
ncbi:hypothetical protein LFADAHJC_LOCUS2653 [Methylorubrum extorquens]